MRKPIKKKSQMKSQPQGRTLQGSKLIKATQDPCPVCGSRLNLYSISSMEYEACGKCGGLWLNKDELRKLKNRTEGGRLHWMNAEIDNIEKTSARATNRPCVKCKDAKLISTVFGHSSIVINWCPKCHGIWLEHSELDGIMGYLKKESLKATPGKLKNVVAMDMKRIVEDGPEGTLAKIGDADAALHALINATIFEHPALVELCMAASRLGLPR
jgi:Zn-finger nucleic acid-binding protein